MLTTSKLLVLLLLVAVHTSGKLRLSKLRSEDAHLQYLFDLLPDVNDGSISLGNDSIRAVRSELSTINTRLWLQFNATSSQLLTLRPSLNSRMNRLMKAELHFFVKPSSRLAYKDSKEDGPNSTVSGVLHRVLIIDRPRRSRRKRRRRHHRRRRRKRFGRRNRRRKSQKRRRLRVLGRFTVVEKVKPRRHRKRQINDRSNAWHRVEITQTLQRHLNSARRRRNKVSSSQQQQQLLLALRFEKRKSNGKVRGVSLQRFLATSASRAPFLTLQLSSSSNAPETLMQLRPMMDQRKSRERRDVQHLLPNPAGKNLNMDFFNMTREAEQPCHAVPHRLHFADLGWNGWILRPESVPFGACVGKCGPETQGASNHATISAALQQPIVRIMSSSGKKSSSNRKPVADSVMLHFPPPPCCVPVVSKATPLVFRDAETGDGVLRIINDLAISNCGCR